MAFPGDEDLKGSQKAGFRGGRQPFLHPSGQPRSVVGGSHWESEPWVGVCLANDHDSDGGKSFPFPETPFPQLYIEGQPPFLG